MTTFSRMEIVLNLETLEHGEVTCDPLFNLPRAVIPVHINPELGAGAKTVQPMPACHLISLGFNWSVAWERLADLRDNDCAPLTDTRIRPPISAILLETRG